MTLQTLIGIMLLVVGIIILVMGLNASDSVADQFSKTFTGNYRDSTNWYIIGGILLGVVGLLLTTVAIRRQHLR